MSFEPVFRPADILLPRQADMEKWSVIACDQFTSDPEYWAGVEKTVGGRPSTLRLFLPEHYLVSGEAETRQREITKNASRYLGEGVFTEVRDSFIYVERTLSNGKVRRGLVGALDLEAYDYREGAKTPVRATEETDVSRLPPRVELRRSAAIELPHILLLADDPELTLIEPIGQVKDELPKLYDFALMRGGGSIRGWRVSGSRAQEALRAADRLYERLLEIETSPILFATGDGNHSLAAAKMFWEELKPGLGGEALKTHPARFALLELTNIRDASLEFDAIHRVIGGADAVRLLKSFKEYGARRRTGTVQTVRYVCGGREGEVGFSCKGNELVADALQDFIDGYLAENPGKLDYIHGAAAAEQLGREPGSAAFILPPIDKAQLFATVARRGKLPKKTFSMGRAEDKRYYLECRKIVL